MVTTGVTRIDLLRHGEPMGGRRYRGQQDDPLSERGWAQMRAAVGDYHPWNCILSSTLSRCADFAAELAQRHQIPLELSSHWVELGFGVWEGQTPAELTQNDPDRLWRFWRRPEHHPPPDAERLVLFEQRIKRAWEQMLEQHAGRHLLLVGHAGMIRMIVAEALGMPRERIFSIQLPNASLTRIEVEQRGSEQFNRLRFLGCSRFPGGAV